MIVPRDGVPVGSGGKCDDFRAGGVEDVGHDEPDVVRCDVEVALVERREAGPFAGGRGRPAVRWAKATGAPGSEASEMPRPSRPRAAYTADPLTAMSVARRSASDPRASGGSQVRSKTRYVREAWAAMKASSLSMAMVQGASSGLTLVSRPTWGRDGRSTSRGRAWGGAEKTNEHQTGSPSIGASGNVDAPDPGSSLVS